VTKNSSIENEWASQFERLVSGEEPVEEAIPREVALIADPIEVLTPEEMGRADALTIESGTASITLMEAAGLAVAESVHDLLPQGGRVLVMTGPGNNGGDGFVAARLLAEAGYEVTVGLLTARDRLKGDAAFAAAAWTGTSKGLSASLLSGADIVVDALFGAGLDRPVEGIAAQTIAAVDRSGLPVVAVDLPSGIDGRTGKVLGTAVKATCSVTFFRLKPGHLLTPGRTYAGRRLVADIGISSRVLSTIQPKTSWNRPGLWSLPQLAAEGHKYDRGHAIVVSGPATRTGAARLAARAALRAGAGLVSLASPVDALAVNAAHLTAIMLLPMNGPEGLIAILADKRHNAVALGPALGVGEDSRVLVEAALASPAAAVIDADGLTSFAEAPERLFGAIKKRQAPVVITPHEGEFARLFPDFAKIDSKPERARQAASASGATVVLKGADTVVATPNGRAAIADNAPAALATAGSGDVLTGMIVGLLAQGMAGYDAACAAVWMHGAAAKTIGRGLIAEDLPEALPAVFAEIGGD
jgi:ADP-dependent NAD(P)H-hydrate dehydratase / NAD(P)H-hydrate epimerase